MAYEFIGPMHIIIFIIFTPSSSSASSFICFCIMLANYRFHMLETITKRSANFSFSLKFMVKKVCASLIQCVASARIDKFFYSKWSKQKFSSLNIFINIFIFACFIISARKKLEKTMKKNYRKRMTSLNLHWKSGRNSSDHLKYVGIWTFRPERRRFIVRFTKYLINSAHILWNVLKSAGNRIEDSTQMQNE